MQIKKHLLDKRVVKRALQEGLLDKVQYQKTLDELPDLSHRVQRAAEQAHEPAPRIEHEVEHEDEHEHEPPPSSSANSF